MKMPPVLRQLLARQNIKSAGPLDGLIPPGVAPSPQRFSGVNSSLAGPTSAFKGPDTSMGAAKLPASPPSVPGAWSAPGAAKAPGWEDQFAGRPKQLGDRRFYVPEDAATLKGPTPQYTGPGPQMTGPQGGISSGPAGTRGISSGPAGLQGGMSSGNIPSPPAASVPSLGGVLGGMGSALSPYLPSAALNRLTKGGSVHPGAVSFLRGMRKAAGLLDTPEPMEAGDMPKPVVKQIGGNIGMPQEHSDPDLVHPSLWHPGPAGHVGSPGGVLPANYESTPPSFLEDMGNKLQRAYHGAGNWAHENIPRLYEEARHGGLGDAVGWAGENWPLLAGGAALGAGAGGLGYLMSRGGDDEKKEKKSSFINPHVLYRELQKIAAKEEEKKLLGDAAHGGMVNAAIDAAKGRESGQLGPVRRLHAAAASGADPVIASLERNRYENPLNYWLNPFVGGPVTEGLERLQRRHNASSADTPALGTLSTLTGGSPGGLYGLRGLAQGIGAANPIGMLAAIPGLATGGVSLALGGEKSRARARQSYQDTGLEKYQEGVDKGAAEGGLPFRTEHAARVLGDDREIAALESNRAENPWHYWLNPFVRGPLTEVGTRLGRRYHASNAAIPGMGVVSAVPALGPTIAAALGGEDTRDRARKLYAETSAPGYQEGR